MKIDWMEKKREECNMKSWKLNIINYILNKLKIIENGKKLVKA